MQSHVLLALREIPNQKNFEVSSWIQLDRFSRKRKRKFFRLIAMIFSLLGLTLLDLTSTQLVN